MLRWIDELNGVCDADERAKEIKHKIKLLRNEAPSQAVKREIRGLYSQLDDIQFKKDYMCLIIDREKDYYRACNGFTINGIRYKRLLGTNGGIKNSTIVFVSERLQPELKRRVENDRNQNIPFVTAKLEAYKALTCSASNPVSYPNGILIVNDAETSFLSDVVYLTDENVDEPTMEYKSGEKISMDASDGYGIMLPSLAERWSQELGLDYMVAGLNSRMAFTKGMIFTFDFVAFAEKVAGSYMVKDAWGDLFDIRQVELILTTSMVKLWDSYDSCEDFISKSIKNGYKFGVAKTCPKKLESERCLNYQFIQSFPLTDADVEELIAPTRDEFIDVLGGDWVKSVLFTKGSGLNERNVSGQENDIYKALMIEHSLINDPYIKNTIYQLIKNKINEAKVGVIKVHGNYSIVSGDPFLLCQSIFGMEPTGLLKSGEIYNKFWADVGSDTLACFRAPMSCRENIRSVHPIMNERVAYWYKYMDNCTIFNAFDTAAAALNGMDFDGDLVMLTDNPVLVRNLKELPTLMCVQRKAQKRIASEEDFIRANIESFGNEIGQTTNWITSMYEVQSKFDPESIEYKTLEYRIRCGQLIQQNVIDKSKGIVAKSMPRSWHDRHAISVIEDDGKRNLYRSIVADKKPYFMRYIYPPLMKQYNTYIKNTDRNALREFQMTVSELRALNDEEITERQKEFLYHFDRRMPVGTGSCVMNKICRAFESEFDGYISKHKDTSFDYTIMKSGTPYTSRQFSAIKDLYLDYNKRLKSYALFAERDRIDSVELASNLSVMQEEFMAECVKVCPNRLALCDIVLDLCYTRTATKRFAWSMCGSEIIHNLLVRNGNTICWPELDESGDIHYCGNTYAIRSTGVDGGVL